MQSPPVRLPPLNALRVFWAVMRRGSFRAAAAELSVSPQAVSQQIKLLEDILGVALFLRRGRAVDPTEQAILLSHFVQAGFDEFAEGVRRVTSVAGRHRITLNVSPYFATRYLIGRLDRFRARMPGADLRLTTMVALPDFISDDVDVSIQWGFGDWPGMEAHLLVRDPKLICCAPALAAAIRRPDDLLRQTLLHPVSAGTYWPRVLRHLGVSLPDQAGEIAFQDADSMRQATLAGMGVGLVSRGDAVEDLDSGRLVAPLGAEVLADMAAGDVPGFYLVLPRAHRRMKTVATFCDWVLAEDWSAPATPLPPG
ncbi:LysR substrate-binding domain-containing protein [Pseudodonghicola flavimaris]|uniref:LysR substrate-binding domain-containing protein n=1 Tax=Pseudodonghicola flavimaris TaxID=3050036 RepID=A0ABT7F2U5_9RHOB|nr:LysR substrate-binding domain-containing protein [Pseudodonghicola flavimaris]MDK3018921.1 LysR substrate-binding domain-containing protein [Pseudodonghicola flavimaris]